MYQDDDIECATCTLTVPRDRARHRILLVLFVRHDISPSRRSLVKYTRWVPSRLVIVLRPLNFNRE